MLNPFRGGESERPSTTGAVGSSVASPVPGVWWKSPPPRPLWSLHLRGQMAVQPGTGSLRMALLPNAAAHGARPMPMAAIQAPFRVQSRGSRILGGRTFRLQCRRSHSVVVVKAKSGASASGTETPHPPNTLMIPLQYYKVSCSRLADSHMRSLHVLIQSDCRLWRKSTEKRAAYRGATIRSQVLGVDSAANRDLIERGYRLVRLPGCEPDTRELVGGSHTRYSQRLRPRHYSQASANEIYADFSQEAAEARQVRCC